jgi:hypothetical protein
MARGNWDPHVIKPKPKCRICRLVVKKADFVRLDGIAPAHKRCAEARGRAFTVGEEIHNQSPKEHMNTIDEKDVARYRLLRSILGSVAVNDELQMAIDAADEDAIDAALDKMLAAKGQSM